MQAQIEQARNIVSVEEDRPSYASIDSAPPGYGVNRSPLVTVAYIVTFAILSALSISASDWLETRYIGLMSALGLRSAIESVDAVSLGLRPFFAVFFGTVAIFWSGTLPQKLRMTAILLGSYVIVLLIVDSLMLALIRFGLPGPYSTMGNVALGYALLIVLAVAIFLQVPLPSSVKVVTRIKRPKRFTIVFLITLVTSAIAAFTLGHFGAVQLDWLRSKALLGGLGPGVLLFMPMLTAQLVIVSALFLRRTPNEFPKYTVAFLVPAFNEAKGIVSSIRSLDVAASNYAGRCNIYIVDNASTDGTGDLARRALSECVALKGEVLLCSTPGKARALNFGLRRALEDIVIRVDSDTDLDPMVLNKVLRHFADPKVGAVGGIPLPRHMSSILSRMRAIEVYQRIGFSRLAFNSIDGVMVVPGILSAARREVMMELGGFSEGMNGEDTDLTIRIGRLGYLVVTDPSVRVYSEVPETLAHLREQRIRWVRGAFHVAARNLSAITMRQGVRGTVIMPWSLVSVMRRSIIVPTIVYAILVMIIDPSTIFLRNGATIGALIVGYSFTIVALILIAYRQFGLLLLVPAYMGYRVVRAYLALEMLFSLPLKAQGVPSMFTKIAEFPPAQSARASTARTLSLPAVAASYSFVTNMTCNAKGQTRRAVNHPIWSLIRSGLVLVGMLTVLVASAVIVSVQKYLIRAKEPGTFSMEFDISRTASETRIKSAIWYRKTRERFVTASQHTVASARAFGKSKIHLFNATSPSRDNASPVPTGEGE